MAKQLSSPPEHEEDGPPGPRQDRLAAALRANLARRKAQARARGDAAAVGDVARADDFADEVAKKRDFDL